MKKLFVLAVILGLFSIPVAAFCADDAAALPKIAVKALKAKGVSDDTAGTLTDILCTRLMTFKKYSVLCASDVNAILSAAQQTSLMGGCDDDKCYEQLGKVLQSPYILSGSIGEVGKTFIITLSIVGAEDHKVIKRITHEVKGDEAALIDGVRQAVDLLMK